MRSSLFFFRSARTHAVLVRLERRLVRFFFVLEEELRPPFCFKQQSFRAGRALRRSRSPVPPLPSVPFVSRKRPGHSRSPPRERTRITKAPAGGFCSSMAAVTSPETSPQPRVYFQTPAGTTEEPETPVRKQGRVTVKYDRKELRKRLNLEEWIIDQLTDLYDCEEEAIPELEIDVDELLDMPSDVERAARVKDLLVDCFKPTEDFVSELLDKIRGMQKLSTPQKK
ncbi:protein phosphatase 1, regulatory (inhibitor) subunit 14Bb isoform X1 [Takifugu flavidus]|uniref:protein phosphatase 1, regulatory (inhibitor) subunit 14Bb isoform X1 n=1 Tax=Takifugu flavidus TaxID=433684 RepID=UPI0025440B63|nr:protein phosphatase 1, regulatory (inhibitor) subunit 14Bb isoform X1 [Takifugu flavidus]